MSVDYTPTPKPYKKIGPFRYWIQKVLPVVFDDSLSYQELLGKVIDYLNTMGKNVETQQENVELLTQAFVDLQDYVNTQTASVEADFTELQGNFDTLQAFVNNYFDNLDVSEEISNKLDAMAENGTLEDIMQPFFNKLYDEYAGDVATLKSQVSSLIAETTTNLSGEKIYMVTQGSSIVSGVADTIFNNLPTGYKVIEVSRDDINGYFRTEGITIKQGINSVIVQAEVPDITVGNAVVFRLIYSILEEVQIPELTDIRIGADGTVYPTAGDAVRGQIEHISEYLSIEWELGTINSSGVNANGQHRVRSIGYTPIEWFYAYESLDLRTTILFCYDATQTFLGRMFDGLSYNYYNKSEVLDKYPTTKYVRFLFYADTVEEVANNIRIYSSLIFYNTIKNNELLKHELDPAGYPYSGERITFNRNRCTYEALTYTGEGQDAVEEGNHFFAARQNGTIVMKRKDTNANRKLLVPSGITPHCNSVVWGHKYDTDDVFRMIYANAYNATGEPNGRCYVFRLGNVDTGGVPQSITTIQTITVGFANGEPWTDGHDIRPYGNFFVDTENNYLWAYTLKDAANVTRFFKFALPDLSVSSVTLTTDDIIEQFDVPYMPYIQGNTYQDGKAYILSGMGTADIPGMLNVVDLTSHDIVSQVNLNKIGLIIEPEFINIEGDNIMLGKTTAQKFTF